MVPLLLTARDCLHVLTTLTEAAAVSAGFYDALCWVGWQCPEPGHSVSGRDTYLGHHQRGHWRSTFIRPGGHKDL